LNRQTDSQHEACDAKCKSTFPEESACHASGDEFREGLPEASAISNASPAPA
jgi:hypothetical protein